MQRNGMLARFETNSVRVKGVSFHSTRPWILCSLHDGKIQLWDYRVGTLLETYEEHKGPVRSVDFHSSQPLFVSGGDDYKIRVWNYNNKRSLFSLLGHKDYIRTVQFHQESPWIVSASDDTTVRIWNWQSRECIAVLQGHNHYVMCAQFHPTDDLVVSASLDQTIRVWDISGLKQKRSNAALPNVPVSVINRLGADGACTVKYILEGHERGVNWASFHPELPLIVSGSDDRMVKIWRTNETKAWEIDTLRGHTNNVSSVLFHPREDLIISDSEDHTIRVWDSTKRVCVQSFMRARDRFWIIASHKQQNLLAAGFDSGAVVFKLSRERIPFTVYQHYCYYIKDRAYHQYNLTNGQDTVIHHFTFGPGCSNNRVTLQYNSYNDSGCTLLCTSQDTQTNYEIIQFKDKKQSEVINGTATSTCFVNRGKFITLEDGSLCVNNMKKQVTKRIPLPIIGCERVFEGNLPSRVLLVTLTDIVSYDYQSDTILAQYTITDVKRMMWNSSRSLLAVVTKQGVTILDQDFKMCSMIQENQHVKDCLWYEDSILFYSTLSQVKYMLASGEQGIIVSLEEPLYIVHAAGRCLYGLNRKQQMIKIEINPTELLFKYYLEQKQYRKAIHIIRKYEIDSKSIISYLQSNGFEDIALHFVSEPRARFNLAIRCGNLDIAMECAAALDEASVWNQLAQEALRQGNHEMVEMAYQRTKSFDKLSFLYVITGNTTKLEKMLKISELRNDVMGRYHNALFLGNVESRIQVLLDVQQYTLAYITAVTHGLTEVADSIRQMMEEEELTIPEVDTSKASLLMPPISVLQESNWPLLEMPRSKFDKLMEEEAKNETILDVEEEIHSPAAEVNESGSESGDESTDEELMISDGENGWNDDDDLVFSDDGEEEETEYTLVPPCGKDKKSLWCESSIGADHVAAGSIATATAMLNRQVALVKPSSLLTQFRRVFLANESQFIGYPSMPSLNVPLSRGSSSLPYIPYSVEHVKQNVKKALKAFQQARFADCSSILDSVFKEILLVVVKDKSEEAELKRYLDLAKEYKLATRIEEAKHDNHNTTERTLDLSSFMTCCKLQVSHQLLALHSAMVTSFKAGQFIDAAYFAKQVLMNPDIESPKNASLAQKAKKVLSKSEREGRNAVSIEFSSGKGQVLDCCELRPIPQGERTVKCSYCGAVYKESGKGQVCSVCMLSRIGVETVGLICMDVRNELFYVCCQLFISI